MCSASEFENKCGDSIKCIVGTVTTFFLHSEALVLPALSHYWVVNKKENYSS